MPEELLDEGNALGMLRSEHEHIRALLANVWSTDQAEFAKMALVPLFQELAVHSAIERQYFFPYCSTAMFAEQPLVQGSTSDSIAIEELAMKLQQIDYEDPAFRTGLEELINRFQHHCYQTEQYIFSHLEGGDWDRHNELVAIAMKMRALRKEMMEQMRPHGTDTMKGTGRVSPLQDEQGRRAQLQGRNLDPARDVVPDQQNRDSSIDVTRTTDGDLMSMGGRMPETETGEEGHPGR